MERNRAATPNSKVARDMAMRISAWRRYAALIIDELCESAVFVPDTLGTVTAQS